MKNWIKATLIVSSPFMYFSFLWIDPIACGVLSILVLLGFSAYGFKKILDREDARKQNLRNIDE